MSVIRTFYVHVDPIQDARARVGGAGGACGFQEPTGSRSLQGGVHGAAREVRDVLPALAIASSQCSVFSEI
jgi:hypothetical protein